ncbi:alpha/beta fold hydrolase [uncultured Draconibacterium sp.]|uniref:alpha/beta hydrolase n=1 Tax=uncultured Draconibacterium sp. TaxID=1573823 RepID=UPI002AA6C817|nr:alpha/beta fold hydrolase [uncultured Draconibacterium sp.]
MKRVIFLALTCFMIVTIGCSNQKGKTQEEPAAVPFSKSVQIQGAVGNLEAELQIPTLKTNEKCPLVIIMHGVFSNREFPVLTEIADSLQSQGIASIRFDFNGHGESDGEFINMTVPSEVKDAKAVFEYCKSLYFVSDISLLGHSQGGVVTSLTAGELKDAVKSVVLLAPAAVMEDQVSAGMMMGVTFDPENIPEFITVFNHQVGREYLSTILTLNIYPRAAEYKGPVCIIHGKADQVVPYSYGERYDEIYSNSTLHLLDGENHLFNQNQSLAAKIAVDFLAEQ